MIAVPAVSRVAALVLGCALAAPIAAQEVEVKVDRHGAQVVIDVSARVAAPLAAAWAVLVDYDHMAAFLSGLKSSKVTQRQGNVLEVAQRGETRFGIFKFSFESVRQIELRPMNEIRSRLVSGDFDSFDATTRLVEQGDHTLIVHHGEYVPTAWVPPMLGTSAISSETRKQYMQLLAEILRRNGGAEAPEAPGKPSGSGARP